MKNIKNENGMALAIVIIIFAIVTITASAALSISLSDTKLSVANENYMQAHYVARSAADVVSNDINAKMKQLKQVEDAMHAASAEDKEEAIQNYEIAKNQFDALNLVPEPGYSNSVRVGGIGVNPVEVIITNESGNIKVSASYQEEGRLGKANVRVGTVSPLNKTLTIPNFSGDNAIYTWGNLIKDKQHMITINGGGIISTGAPKPENNPLDGVVYNDKRGVGIIAPPTVERSKIKNAGNLKDDKAAININKNDSGYYDVLDFGNNNKSVLNWNVDTSQGDVILIFSSLRANNGATINVSGNNHLYIYLEETDNPAILGFNNGLTINSVGDSNAVRTTIVAYTNEMQTWYEDPIKIAAGTNDFIPEDQVVTTGYNNIGTWNNLDVNAYMYLPYCSFSVKNSPTITGALYSGSFTFGNNGTVNYKPFESDNEIFQNNPALQGEPIEVIVPTYAWDLEKIWVK